MPVYFSVDGRIIPYVPRTEIQPVGKVFEAILAEKSAPDPEAPAGHPGGGGGGAHPRQAYPKPAHPSDARRPAILLSQVMTAPAVTLGEGAPVSEAAALMRRRRFRHLPVVSPEGRLVGILSDRDLLPLAPPPSADAARPVREVMTTRVLTGTRDTRIREAAEIMLHERISALPVVDAEGALEGIVTVTDILRAVVEQAPLDLWA